MLIFPLNWFDYLVPWNDLITEKEDWTSSEKLEKFPRAYQDSQVNLKKKKKKPQKSGLIGHHLKKKKNK